MRRYPLAPLAALAGCEVQQLASRLRVSGTSWKEYRDLGVSEKVADRLATKLGFAAYNVWPEMVEHVIEDEAAARRRERAAQQRRWRANNPESAQRERDRRRVYYQECGEAERSRERRRYWVDVEASRARMRARRDRLKEAG